MGPYEGYKVLQMTSEQSFRLIQNSAKFPHIENGPDWSRLRIPTWRSEVEFIRYFTHAKRAFFRLILIVTNY